MRTNNRNASGFTLIELLVVIAIIAILIGLLFPAFSAVQNQARKTQAKNDLTQIVTAVNAYYTEYGNYPSVGETDDTAIADNSDLFYTLRAVNAGTANAGNAANPRIIVFISPPNVKNPNNPRSGIGTNGQYCDPWGTPYKVAIDISYDNQMTNPYTANTGAGPSPLQIGVIAWSLGPDGVQGATVNGSTCTPGGAGFNCADDVISWQ